MIAAWSRQLIEEEGYFWVALLRQALDVNPPALFFRQLRSRSFRVNKRPSVVSWPGKTMQAFFIHEQQRISISLGVKWKSSPVLTRVLPELQATSFNAMDVRLHEYKRMREIINDGKEG